MTIVGEGHNANLGFSLHEIFRFLIQKYPIFRRACGAISSLITVYNNLSLQSDFSLHTPMISVRFQFTTP